MKEISKLFLRTKKNKNLQNKKIYGIINTQNKKIL